MTDRQITCSACSHNFAAPASAPWVICPVCGHSEDENDATEVGSAMKQERPRRTTQPRGAQTPDHSQQLARIALRKVPSLKKKTAPPVIERSRLQVSDPFESSDDDEFVGALLDEEAASTRTLINTESEPDPLADSTELNAPPPSVEELRSKLGFSGGAPKPPSAPPLPARNTGVDLDEIDDEPGTGIDLPARPQPVSLTPSQASRPGSPEGTGIDLPHRGPSEDRYQGTGIDLPARPITSEHEAPLAPKPPVVEPATGIDLPAQKISQGAKRPMPPAVDPATGINAPPNVRAEATKHTGVDLPHRPTGQPVDLDFFDPPTMSAVQRLQNQPSAFAPLSGEVPIETEIGLDETETEEQVIEDDEEDEVPARAEPSERLSLEVTTDRPRPPLVTPPPSMPTASPSDATSAASPRALIPPPPPTSTPRVPPPPPSAPQTAPSAPLVPPPPDEEPKTTEALTSQPTAGVAPAIPGGAGLPGPMVSGLGIPGTTRPLTAAPTITPDDLGADLGFGKPAEAPTVAPPHRSIDQEDDEETRSPPRRVPTLADAIADGIADEIGESSPTAAFESMGDPFAAQAAPEFLPSENAPATLPEEGIMVFVPDAPILERQADGEISGQPAPPAEVPAPPAVAPMEPAPGQSLAPPSRRSEAAGHGMAIKAGTREKERRTWLIILFISLGAAALVVGGLVLINQLTQ